MMYHPRYCAKCGADQRAGEIPREHVEKGYYGEDDGKPKYYYKWIGIYCMDADRTLYFKCSECGGKRERQA
jgi:hypothetical protein